MRREPSVAAEPPSGPRTTARARAAITAAAQLPPSRRRAAVAELPPAAPPLRCTWLEPRPRGGQSAEQPLERLLLNPAVPCATSKRWGLSQRRRCVDSCWSKNTQVESFTDSCAWGLEEGDEVLKALLGVVRLVFALEVACSCGAAPAEGGLA